MVVVAVKVAVALALTLVRAAAVGLMMVALAVVMAVRRPNGGACCERCCPTRLGCRPVRPAGEEGAADVV